MGAVYSYLYPEASSENTVTEVSPNTHGPAPTQPVSVRQSEFCNTTGTDHSYPDSCPEVDRRNIFVKNSGKSVQVDVFPEEKIMELLKEACQHFQKKEACMKIVYNGEEMDVQRTIREAQLKAGCTVNLIRAC